MIKMGLGDMIYHLRTTHKYSQNSLADKLNFTRQTVSKWDNDVSQPDFETLKRIADIYRFVIYYFEKQMKEKNKPTQTFNRHKLTFLSLIYDAFYSPLSLFCRSLFPTHNTTLSFHQYQKT